MDAGMILHAGLDVIDIMTSRFQREMGRQFERVWLDSLEKVGSLSRQLFEGIHPGSENRDINTHIIRSRWEDRDAEEEVSTLLASFQEMIDVHLAAVRRVLGSGIVREAEEEAVRVLSLVEKYKGSGEVVRAFMETLTPSRTPSSHP